MADQPGTPKRRKTTPAGRPPRTAKTSGDPRVAPAAASAPNDDHKPARPRKADAAPDAAADTTAQPADQDERIEQALLGAVTESTDSNDGHDSDKTDDRYKRQDLIQAVSERSGLKKNEVKLVIDMTLEELGRAVDANEEVVVKPFGKMTIKKRTDSGNGPVLTVKLKRDRPSPDAGAETPLAKHDAES